VRPLSSFFAKFDTLTPPRRVIRRAVIEVVEEAVGITLEETHIEVTRDAVFLRTPSIVKSEVLLHAQEVLSALHKRLPPSKRHITKIY